ncbi:MAG: DapH/DapD/GlmU-related protein [Marmoricola sp.]
MPLLRRAFANIGANTVIVRPRTLRGVAQISLGADCSIFEGAWLQCGVKPGSQTSMIGDRTYLGHDVHVHSIDPVHIGSDCVLADYELVTSTDHDGVERKVTHGTGAVMIGDRVFIGQGATVLGGVTIGDGATIAAHGVVDP